MVKKELKIQISCKVPKSIYDKVVVKKLINDEITASKYVNHLIKADLINKKVMTEPFPIIDVKLYNRVFNIYEIELSNGDLKNIDGDYLVKATHFYCIPEFTDTDIRYWLYKVYALDKENHPNVI